MALFVGRLPSEIRSRDLEDLFYKFGRIIRCDVKAGWPAAQLVVAYRVLLSLCFVSAAWGQLQGSPLARRNRLPRAAALEACVDDRHNPGSMCLASALIHSPNRLPSKTKKLETGNRGQPASSLSCSLVTAQPVVVSAARPCLPRATASK
ncbi:MAG: hypothetical protein BJ554DRAFT_3701 [Olpidium bornovanus]|uniref:RRM domain-containing protein n=1 Tax=Olpidium bornovanus TaxID=278681 RepID=A0A8H8A0M2_9FUNG|nr:MAG: hypothetical protein BJ554DRAFT_3701 [Olpidium bornovanus]